MFKLILLVASLCTTPLWADNAKIKGVVVQRSGDIYNFDVTVSHGDTGWDHYVDAWRVVDEQGNVLGVRRLAHPHVNEQPFTRSLSGVRIPRNISVVLVQARDTSNGWAPDYKRVSLR